MIYYVSFFIFNIKPFLTQALLLCFLLTDILCESYHMLSCTDILFIAIHLFKLRFRMVLYCQTLLT